jgi:hypothetical protein
MLLRIHMPCYKIALIAVALGFPAVTVATPSVTCPDANVVSVCGSARAASVGNCLICMSTKFGTACTGKEMDNFCSRVPTPPSPHGTCGEVAAGVARTGGGPQCDQNGNYMPVQCVVETGECYCAYSDTGKELPNTRRNQQIDGGILTPETCLSVASVSFAEVCVPYGDACPRGFVSEKCPHCDEAAMTGSSAGTKLVCTINGAEQAKTSGEVKGLCKLGVPSSVPTGILSPADQAVIDKFNADFVSGVARFQDDLLRQCSVHNLQLLCDDEIGAAKMMDPAVFCVSHCLDWCLTTLDYCSAGQLPADVVHQLLDRVNDCDDAASSAMK